MVSTMSFLFVLLAVANVDALGGLIGGLVDVLFPPPPMTNFPCPKQISFLDHNIVRVFNQTIGRWQHGTWNNPNYIPINADEACSTLFNENVATFLTTGVVELCTSSSCEAREVNFFVCGSPPTSGPPCTEIPDQDPVVAAASCANYRPAACLPKASCAFSSSTEEISSTVCEQGVYNAHSTNYVCCGVIGDYTTPDTTTTPEPTTVVPTTTSIATTASIATNAPSGAALTTTASAENADSATAGQVEETSLSSAAPAASAPALAPLPNENMSTTKLAVSAAPIVGQPEEEDNGTDWLIVALGIVGGLCGLIIIVGVIVFVVRSRDPSPQLEKGGSSMTQFFRAESNTPKPPLSDIYDTVPPNITHNYGAAPVVRQSEVVYDSVLQKP